MGYKRDFRVGRKWYFQVKKYNFHFIPNTHLDREWTMDFQHTRKLTVEFIDTLLKIMKRIPEYRFLLDAQTVPLEDYLQIRPENKSLISRWVKSGRIEIGPWYTAPDMNCISGESVVRNLLTGHRIAKEFGRVMKVGYTPFGFVHISQLPQIYAGFSIDVCYFYRGIDSKLDRAEFWWTSPDGTRILASKLSKKPRFNFYFDVWRPVFYAGQKDRLDRRYNWYDGQVPVKLCGEDTRFDHGYLFRPEKEMNEKTIPTVLRKLIETEKTTFATSEIAFMHGMDTSMPDLREDELIRKCQPYLLPGEKLFYSSLTQYTKKLKKAINKVKIPKLYGEMTYPIPGWPGFQITFVNIISTRPKLKLLLSQTENMLVRTSEPFATVSFLLGVEYPVKYLESAWKYMLKSQAHDTIAGCTVDRVEEDATYRLNQTNSLAKMILKESLGTIQTCINTNGIPKDTVLLTVFNPSPFSRTEIITAYIDIPRELGIKNFSVFDSQNQPVPFHVIPTGNVGKIYRDKTDLALFSETDEYRLDFTVNKVPALGYKTFLIKRDDPLKTSNDIKGVPLFTGKPKISTYRNLLENQYVKVKINATGTFDVTNKRTGYFFKGIHFFLDNGEAGTPWQHVPPGKDEIITSKQSTAKIELIANNDLYTQYKIDLEMKVPQTVCYDETKRITDETRDTSYRSRNKVILHLSSTVTLKQGAPYLEFQTKINNNSENHRLRLMLPTNLSKAKYSYAETPFDVIERVIEKDKNHPYYKAQNPQYSFLRFVGLTDGQNGLSFISNGLHEYEVTDDQTRTLAITLIRAVEIRLCTTSVWDKVPGKLIQSLGENTFTYYIYPHTKDWNYANVFKVAETLNYPLTVCQTAPEHYQKMGIDNKLPLEYSFFELKGQGLVLSCIKKTEDNDGIIVRIYNPDKKDRTGRLKVFKPIKRVWFTNLNEEKIQRIPVNRQKNELKFTVPAKKIVTISAQF